MTDHDLLDRMARSTEWTNDLTADPAADIARGRSRLLRRRLGVGAGAASVAVVVAATLALPTYLGPGPGQPAVPQEAARPSTALSFPVRPYAPPTEVARSAQAWKNLEVVLSHVDPDRTHVARKPYPFGQADTRAADPNQLEAAVPWVQGLGSGVVKVDILDKSRVGRTIEDPLGSGVRKPHPAASPSHCPRAPYLKLGGTPYSSCAYRTVAGKRVLVGTMTGRPKAYFARYVRPDGDMVTAEIDGNGMRTFTGNRMDERRPPVANPSIVVADLIAAVTDESLIPPR